MYSSFREYTAVEVLNGKNKYAVDQAGKMEYVDAEKGVWFETMPPVIIVCAAISRLDVHHSFSYKMATCCPPQRLLPTLGHRKAKFVRKALLGVRSQPSSFSCTSGASSTT